MQLIHERMSKVFQDIGLVGVPKDKIMQKYNYKFRDIDSIMNTLNPIFGKNNIHIELNTLKKEITEEKDDYGKKVCTVFLTVRYRFIAEDGSSVSSIVIGEGRDNFDKATAKAYSSAMKTALLQKFMIPTECLWKEEEEKGKSFNERAEEFIRNIEDDLPSFMDLDIAIVQDIYDRDFKSKIHHVKTTQDIKDRALALFSKVKGLKL